jgi:hypothetical protein
MLLSAAIKTYFPWLETWTASSGAIKMLPHFALVIARLRQLLGGAVAQLHAGMTG